MDKPTRHYLELDGLRGVCACMVMLLHFPSQSHIADLAVVKHAFLFVDFFFVLSGFVIGASYGERIMQGYSLGRFMWLRFARIYPLHFAVLLAFLCFEIMFFLLAPASGAREPFTDAFSPESFVQSLLLVQIFFGPDALPWNGPSWSIAAEMWTYFLFALLLRRGRTWLVPACLVIVAAAPIYLAMMSDRYINVFHDGALPRSLYGFALGMIAWRLAEHVRAIRLPRLLDSMVEILLAIATVALVSFVGAGPWSLAAPLLFFLVVLVFSRGRGVVSRVLRSAPFVLIGALSYSIYLIHVFLIYRLMNLLERLGDMTGHELVIMRGGHALIGASPWVADLITLLFLAFVLGLAFVTHKFVECRGQDFLKAFPGRLGLRAAPAQGGVS